MDDFLFFDTSPFIAIGIIIGVIWLAALGICCCRYFCKASHRRSEEPIQISPTRPAPFFVPARPSAPPPVQFADPPPYSEVALKPNVWPLLDQLPSYDNIDRDGVPPPDMSQHPRFNAQGIWT